MLNGGDFTESLDKEDGEIRPDSDFIQELVKNVGDIKDLDELRKAGINLADLTNIESETL